MKYKQNKTVNLVLTLVLLLSLCITPLNTSYAGEPSERNVTTGLTGEEQLAIASSAFDKERLANLDISRELYIKLIDSFSQEPVPVASDYPDWYGGCFMNDQGKLVIYVTPDYSEGVQLLKVEEEVINIVGSDDILFEPCEYSYRYLTETMDYLNSTMLGAKGLAVADNFNSFGVYDKENRVIVFQEADTNKSITADESIKEFMNNAYDKGCIIFAESEGMPIDQANVNPGDYLQSETIYGSVGYRARRSGVDGIVTAGHVANTTTSGSNSIYNYNGTKIAECTTRQQSGSVDAAFCKITNSSYVPTNTIMSGTLLTSTLNPAVGDVVYKIGDVSDATSGTVQSTNFSASFNGVPFTNLSKATYYSETGDSGGLVFTFNMSTNTGYTVGIVKGIYGGDGVYVKASLANSALGITRY
ncbi:MAG TPA: hypothetical protein VM577_20235 [Anaerovoracaceae bacterium]|nr:hypothetical protein [Anaerovoracaceae bacterium]